MTRSGFLKMILGAIGVTAMAPAVDAASKVKRWNKNNSKLETKKAVVESGQVSAIKTLLSDARVDQITSLAEYRTYQKKINKLLRGLLKTVIDTD